LIEERGGEREEDWRDIGYFQRAFIAQAAVISHAGLYLRELMKTNGLTDGSEPDHLTNVFIYRSRISRYSG